MFTKPLTDIFQVCLSIISFSVLIDILTNRLHFYLNQKITGFRDKALENTIYKPLIQRFGKYISLIDAVLNILIANLIGLLAPQALDPVFWVSIIVLIVDIAILLPRYKQLVSKIRYIKSRSVKHKK